MKTYYKVVALNLTSCFTQGKAEVQYKVGKYVSALKWIPKAHKFLFVFNSLHSAHDFASRSYSPSGLFVYKCKVRRVSRHLPRYLDTSVLSDGKIELFDFTVFPSDTVAVREVKLIKKIT